MKISNSRIYGLAEWFFAVFFWIHPAAFYLGNPGGGPVGLKSLIFGSWCCLSARVMLASFHDIREVLLIIFLTNF